VKVRGEKSSLFSVSSSLQISQTGKAVTLLLNGRGEGRRHRTAPSVDIFVAIKNRNILGTYNTFNEALEITLKTEQIGTFLIQECFESREKLVHHFQGNVISVST